MNSMHLLTQDTNHHQGIDPPTIYLNPGEIYFARNPSKIITILGSCVSLVMYSRCNKIGAICHAVLPSFQSAGSCLRPVKDIFQYVDSSVEWMLLQFEEAGIRKETIEVKIFGGSDMFSGNKKCSITSVGRKNIREALNIVQQENLKITAWNIGGTKGRKIIFYSETGEVYLKDVKKTILDLCEVQVTYQACG